MRASKHLRHKITPVNMAVAGVILLKREFDTLSSDEFISFLYHYLPNMFIGEPAGNTDRLLDFSTPITGTLFFVPSYDLLGELGE